MKTGTLCPLAVATKPFLSGTILSSQDLRRQMLSWMKCCGVEGTIKHNLPLQKLSSRSSTWCQHTSVLL